MGSFQGRIVRKLPPGVQAHPLEAAFIVLGIPSGITTMVGVTTSAALARTLPPWAVFMWGLLLLVGCVTWGIGLITARFNGDGNLHVYHAPIMVFGLTLTCTVCFVFGLAILFIAGWNGVNAAGPLFAFAAGTYIRRVRVLIGLKGV